MSNAILQVGKNTTISKVMIELEKIGYQKVEGELFNGSFSLSGGNISIFPVNFVDPYRIEFFGNIVESILNIKTREKIDKLEILANIVYLDDGTSLKYSDHIVHIDHGIGEFRGITRKYIEAREIEYIKISFLNENYLYLPIELKDKITKYLGVGKRPKLSRLGSDTWQKTKQKAYRSALKMAKDLLFVYAQREIVKKKAYTIDKSFDKEIRGTFYHLETVDQAKAISEVYSDLQKTKPMDRLVVGDVGFGKTEVAFRAIAQAVANGKQALIISPTTILAQQHYSNILARFSNLPISIKLMSRMVVAKDQQKIITAINSGNIDIVIATHKIFNSNIKFKNLDLIVIDEEQKFGVKQKEYFKKIRKEVNVLSLSATPIPRTLFISLSGIRDISQISSPPKGRRNIITKVAPYSLGVIKEYILKECQRGGQVYYLYNDVKTMQLFKKNLQKALPHVSITYAHGQMSPASLTETMQKFVEQKYQVLICSTIIENGLDLPNVNTLVVDRSENFGLSQLYQIRGRIGRSTKQAYCLLTLKSNNISNNAYKRLKSLDENSELGCGFNIALNDLEIRGGGNILGREQHGNMESVGLILYSQLLQRAVKAIR